MPGNTTGYGDSTWARYRRWQERLTLKQYALFTGILSFIIATIVAAIFSAIDSATGSRSWLGLPGWAVPFVPTMTVLLTAAFTWLRWDALRNKQEQENASNSRGTVQLACNYR